jgi:hypothetical protein
VTPLFVKRRSETYSAAQLMLKVTLAAKPDMPNGVTKKIFVFSTEGVTVHEA